MKWYFGIIYQSNIFGFNLWRGFKMISENHWSGNWPGNQFKIQIRRFNIKIHRMTTAWQNVNPWCKRRCTLKKQHSLKTWPSKLCRFSIYHPPDTSACFFYYFIVCLHGIFFILKVKIIPSCEIFQGFRKFLILNVGGISYKSYLCIVQTKPTLVIKF